MAIDALHGVFAVKIIGPAWLRKLMGDDRYFYELHAVTVGQPSQNPHDVTDEEIEQLVVHLKRMPKLEAIYIEGRAVTDTALRNLKDLQQIESLRLPETSVTDRGLDYLAELRGLKRLDLAGTKVTAEGIRRLQEKLPDCEIDN